MDIVESAREPPPVAVERAATQPGMSGAPIPGNDPVVERQPEQRQILVGPGDGGQTFQAGAKVVAKEPNEPAKERRRICGDERRAIKALDEPPRYGERVRARGRRFEDGGWIGGEVGPSSVAARSCALEEREAGQVAERFRDVDRASSRNAVRQPPEAKGRARS